VTQPAIWYNATVINRSSLIENLQPPAGLRLVHGFTDRKGGVSRGLYASLNLGRKWGDDREAVDENYARVARAVGYAPECLRLVRQVHGSTMMDARRLDPSSEADGLWLATETSSPLVVGVLTADCVPILIVDEQARLVAAVHSGWRGTVANIAGEAVQTLRDQGARGICAAIGPCIEQAGFEVGPEVAEQFAPGYVKMVEHTHGFRPHVDLVAVVRDQLFQAGVAGECIDRVGGCTYTNSEKYFSYRRDGSSGQQLSVIGYVHASG